MWSFGIECQQSIVTMNISYGVVLIDNVFDGLFSVVMVGSYPCPNDMSYGGDVGCNVVIVHPREDSIELGWCSNVTAPTPCF